MKFRWSCDRDGCWNDKFRLRFDDMGMNAALPGSRCFTDVDALTNVDGSFLLQEWKDWAEPGPLSVGQDLLYRALTRTCPNIQVLAVLGSTQAGSCHHVSRYEGGRQTKWKPYTLDQLNEWTRRWGLRAVADRR